MNITNDAQMSMILNDIAHDVAKAVADKLYQTNQEEIEAIVYKGYICPDPNDPNRYKRSESGGFKDAWETKVSKGTAELNYAPEKMVLDENNYVHGSPESGDIRTELATIIYEGIGSGSYHRFGYGTYAEPRDAFRELIKRCNQSLDKWIVDEFVKRGFSRKDIKYVIGGKAWGVSIDGTD